MNRLFCCLFVCALAACAPSPTPSVDDDDDDATEADDGRIETIDEYLTAYCADYAVVCGVFPTVEECYDHYFEAWFTDCEVADVDAMNVCIDWITSLSCEDQGWIDECDQAFVCE